MTASSAKPSKASTSKEPYLKGKNAFYLWPFIGINFAVFLCLLVTNGLTEASLERFWQRVTLKNGIFAAGIPIAAIVLAGVLSDTAKGRLVFWRWDNPLPGCRVFSALLATDPRIDALALRRKLGEFPDDARAQNALWFTVYRRHKERPRVLEAHKLYLLTRDMAAIAAAFLVLLPVIVFMGSVAARVSELYILALLLQYIVVASAARNYGNRFVLNVLSEELHS